MAIRFLLDENIRTSVRLFLQQRGHEAIRVQDHLTPGTEDPIVVAYAHQIDAVVVTRNRKHFHPLIHRDPNALTADFMNAGLLTFQCSESAMIPLLKQHIDLIEFEYERRRKQDDKRIIIRVSHDGLMIY
ncbi:MAG: DUF5615 family PIN-like protein [Thermomicrobiales bacterium]|nr:DUF5615 family PIN-like protein [Thermomicrobiales bacterium]